MAFRPFAFDLRSDSFRSGHALTYSASPFVLSAAVPHLTILWFAIAIFLALTRAPAKFAFLSDVLVGAGTALTRRGRSSSISSPLSPVPGSEQGGQCFLSSPILTPGQASRRLTALEIVLGVDNILFLSIAIAPLTSVRRTSARRIGLSLALVMRIALLTGIVLDRLAIKARGDRVGPCTFMARSDLRGWRPFPSHQRHARNSRFSSRVQTRPRAARPLRS